MTFEKIYGAKERQDGLYKIGRNKYEARFGYGVDGENGYDYRKQFRYKPTLDELKEEIIEIVNEAVYEKILTGYVYDGKPVVLSSENQFNYKAAYDLAMQENGATLPIKVKLGTVDSPEYVTFDKMDDFKAFYVGAIQFVQNTLQEGWDEKDGIDWTKFECDE